MMPTSSAHGSAPTPHPEPDDISLGMQLLLLRKKTGLSITEVSAQTNISSSNLKAIEEENFDQLPADTFTRGLVALYGNFLGIDGVTTAKSYIQLRHRHSPVRKKSRINYASGRSLNPKKLAEPSHISSATIAGILLIIIVTSFSLFCLYNNWNPFASFLDHRQQMLSPLASTLYTAQTSSMRSDTVMRQSQH